MKSTLKLYLIFIFLWSTFGFSQEKSISDQWLDHYEAGVAKYQAQSYQEAIDDLEKAKSMLSEIDFSNSPDYIYYPVYNYDYLANSYFANNQFEQAAQNFLLALEKISQISNADLGYGKDLLDALINSYERYAPDLAESMLEEMLLNVAETNGKNSVEYVEILYKQARIKYTLLKPHESKDLWKEGISILDSINQTSQSIYPLMVFNLAYDNFHATKYTEALPYFAKAISMKERFSTDPNIDLGYIYSHYGQSAYKAGDYDLAIKILTELNNDPWSSYPRNMEQYLYNNNYIGLSQFYRGDVKASVNTYRNSIQRLRGLKRSDPCTYALQETNLAKIYIEDRQYDNAIEISKETYDFLKRKSLTTCQAYTNATNNLGLLFMYKSRYEEAEQFLKEALELQNNSDNPSPLFIADITNNLAFVSQQKGDYAKAKIYHEAALETKLNLLDENSIEYARAISNFGTFLFETGYYHQAENNFLEALRIYTNRLGKESNLTIETQLNLAMVYQSLRRLKESISAYERVIDYFQKKDIKNEILAYALMGKAVCLASLGNIDTALVNAKESVAITETLFGKQSIQYSEIVMPYARLLQNNGEFLKANDLVSETYSYLQKNFKSGTKQNVEIIEYYIDDLLDRNQFEEASDIIEVYEPFVFTNFGFESYEYAQLLVKKLKIYDHYKDYDYAFEVFENVKKLFSSDLSKDSDVYNQLQFSYAKMLDKAGETTRAVREYQDFFNGVNARIENVFTYRNEQEKKIFLNQLEQYQDWLNATIAADSVNYNSLNETALNNQLLLKGLLLNSSKNLLTNLGNLGDQKVDQIIDQYSSLKYQLSNPAVIKNDGKSKQLKEELAQVETQLVQLYDERISKTQSNNFSRDWKMVRDKLKSNEVAIEFFEFEARSGSSLTGEKVYAAYVIKPNQELPRLIRLTETENLKKRLKGSSPSKLYKSRGSRSKNKNADTKGLYELIWKPLESYLDETTVVYFSPSGLLNQIPFAALADDEGKLLLEKYELNQLSSTFNISRSRNKTDIESALLIGGVDYESNNQITGSANEYGNSFLTNSNATRSFDTSWNYLPGTLNEVENINMMLSGKNTEILKWSNQKASEQNFKSLSNNSPDVIHIATHGYFFENPSLNAESNSNETSVYAMSTDPLLRSGLLLAGANIAWKSNGKSLDSNDGMLTALEISNLNLTGTQLAVLSACETGLGDIDGSEGVYGLQRAFKMAGVETLIMSLWEVPDEETSEFMQHFYNELVNGKTLTNAFRNTQLAMSNKYEDTPEKWAAFILFE